jgi:hypothetical protein
VQEALELLRKYLPKWQVLEDFALDAEALNKISSVVQLQGNWIKHRTSTLFVDPLLIELKIKMFEATVLADIFRNSWHPIVEMDRLTPRRIHEAIEYWNHLLPLDERYLKLPKPTDNLGLTSLEELVNSQMMSEEGFNDLLQQLWIELKAQAAQTDDGQVPYWNFIYASSYDETVSRAYLTSFLLTYGFATMEIDRINETSFLIPRNEPKEISLKEQMISIPISIDFTQWKNMGENR